MKKKRKAAEWECSKVCGKVFSFFSIMRRWLKRDILLFYTQCHCWVRSCEIYAKSGLWSISILKSGRVIIFFSTHFFLVERNQSSIWNCCFFAVISLKMVDMAKTAANHKRSDSRLWNISRFPCEIMLKFCILIGQCKRTHHTRKYIVFYWQKKNKQTPNEAHFDFQIDEQECCHRPIWIMKLLAKCFSIKWREREKEKKQSKSHKWQTWIIPFKIDLLWWFQCFSLSLTFFLVLLDRSRHTK